MAHFLGRSNNLTIQSQLDLRLDMIDKKTMRLLLDTSLEKICKGLTLLPWAVNLENTIRGAMRLQLDAFQDTLYKA